MRKNDTKNDHISGIGHDFLATISIKMKMKKKTLKNIKIKIPPFHLLWQQNIE